MDHNATASSIEPYPSSPTCYLAPSLCGRVIEAPDYRGVFAVAPIAQGEVLAVWGGDVVVASQLHLYEGDARRRLLQIDEGIYVFSRHEGPADWINHSCEPNAGMRGQLTLVAMRDIEPGEQICYDYAMTDGSSYDEFECLCGSGFCRGRIGGDDWRLPQLWRRYGSFYSPYLLRRIEQAQAMRRTPVRGIRKGRLAAVANGSDAE